MFTIPSEVHSVFLPFLGFPDLRLGTWGLRSSDEGGFRQGEEQKVPGAAETTDSDLLLLPHQDLRLVAAVAEQLQLGKKKR